MTPQVEENAENTDFVLMYKCKNDKCPKSVWMTCKGFTLKESKCSLCKVMCTPLHTDEVSCFFIVFKKKTIQIRELK